MRLELVLGVFIFVVVVIIGMNSNNTMLSNKLTEACYNGHVYLVTNDGVFGSREKAITQVLEEDSQGNIRLKQCVPGMKMLDVLQNNYYKD